MSPSPPQFAYTKYLQDWTRWVELGILNEVFVQVYREEPAFLQSELDRKDFYDLRDKLPIGIGLYTGPANGAKSIEQIQTEVNISQDSGYEHISLFSWETTFWIFKNGSASELKRIFDTLFGKA